MIQHLPKPLHLLTALCLLAAPGCGPRVDLALTAAHVTPYSSESSLSVCLNVDENGGAANRGDFIQVTPHGATDPVSYTLQAALLDPSDGSTRSCASALAHIADAAVDAPHSFAGPACCEIDTADLPPGAYELIASVSGGNDPDDSNNSLSLGTYVP